LTGGRPAFNRCAAEPSSADRFCYPGLHGTISLFSSGEFATF
jgi:hypothetical protein